MKKLFICLACVLAYAALLCACGAAAPAATATPEPTPTPTEPPTEYTVTDESAEEILALADIESLERVDASGSHEYEALLELYNARPDVEVSWNYELGGQSYPNTTQELKVTSLDGLEDALRYLPELNYVDVIDTEATVDDLDRFSAIRPDIFYYWSFVHDGFTIRTDIECYSSLRGDRNHGFSDETMYPMLKYCKHLKALDLGHNQLTDSSISLIGELTELEVLIIADNPFTDASPLGNLSNLVYLEMFMCHGVDDFSFLNNLTKLVDLNLCYDEGLTDLDFLANTPDIKFFLFKYTSVTQEDYEYWQAQYPEAILNIGDGNRESCESGWRETERNYQIRYAFACWRSIVDYRNYWDVDYNFDTYNY